MADDPQIETAGFPAPKVMTCSGCHRELRDEYFVTSGRVSCADCAEDTRKFVAGSGSGAGRFAQAALFGLGAAIAGAAVYAGTMILAHTEWALISIGIGWAVGKAVRYGSRNRGGWRYQVLAMFLTYTSICAAYGAVAWQEIGHPTTAQILSLAGALYTLPLMGGAQNAMGWAIIAIGLWQAWKMNQPIKVEITGPHPVATAPV